MSKVSKIEVSWNTRTIIVHHDGDPNFTLFAAWEQFGDDESVVAEFSRDDDFTIYDNYGTLAEWHAKADDWKAIYEVK